MQLLVGLTLVGLIVLCLVSLFQLKDSMLEDRKQKTRDIVEVAVGIVKHHHQLAASGKISEEDAKNAARDSLRDLRYGEDDYYFGFDTEGVYFLHGGSPKLEGQNKLDMQDTHGKYIVRELIAAAKAGGGFVDYWFPRAGQQNPEPKLGYTTLFTPWNWVVGTGI
jgi:methyl-accepting chemotaxis protein